MMKRTLCLGLILALALTLAPAALAQEVWVGFETYGGTAIAPVIATAGQPVPLLVEPEKPGYRFAGWYADPWLTQPWELNAPAYEGLTLYARWDNSPVAYPSVQTIFVDEDVVELPVYAVLDDMGNATNYVAVRDVAQLLNGSQRPFNVGYYDSLVHLVSWQYYVPEGGELEAPLTGPRSYLPLSEATDVNGQLWWLDAIRITDDMGGGHTYYKLRDLGMVLGFGVYWTPETGIILSTKLG